MTHCSTTAKRQWTPTFQNMYEKERTDMKKRQPKYGQFQSLALEVLTLSSRKN